MLWYTLVAKDFFAVAVVVAAAVLDHIVCKIKMSFNFTEKITQFIIQITNIIFREIEVLGYLSKILVKT